MSFISRPVLYSLKSIGVGNCRRFVSSSICRRLHMISGERHIVCCRSRPSWFMLEGRRSLCSEQLRRPSFNSFLTEEIEMENAAWRQREAGKGEPFVAGFDISFDGAMIILKRQYDNPVPETVTVKFNVSGSVNSNMDEDDSGEDLMRHDSSNDEATNATSNNLYSRPEFTIDVQRKNKILSFLCSFINPRDLSPVEADDSVDVIDDSNNHQSKYSSSSGQHGDDHTFVREDEAADSQSEDFQINEFAIYESDMSSEQHSKVYSAECSVIDGELYDYLLEFLEKRGIDDKFAAQVVRLSTLHEHDCYVKLLRNVKEFIKGGDTNH
ncbi:hypothetical protein GJ496_010926 [Pomphorhynchus laevis]|nr:hypothetical protein GJ496_010926 [Pomphorhynchus laevis]